MLNYITYAYDIFMHMEKPNLLSQSPLEREKSAVEAALFFALEQGSLSRTNEGSNAYICVIESSHFENEKLALKVLKRPVLVKMGESTAIRQEFENHKKILEILTSNSVDACPKVYDEGMCHMDDSHASAMERLTGIKLRDIEAMTMDFIVGKDLAHIQYEELLTRTIKSYKKRMSAGAIISADHKIYPYLSLSDEEIQKLPFSQLQEIVSELFFFDAKNKEYRDLAYHQNATIIQTELIKLGFAVAPEVITQIKKIISLLESKGVCLLDCHDRNIMIEGDITSPDAKVYFIDFEKVRFHSSPIRESDYQDADGTRYPVPSAIPIRLAYMNQESARFLEKEKNTPSPEAEAVSVLLNFERRFNPNNELGLGLTKSRNPQDTVKKVALYKECLLGAILDIIADEKRVINKTTILQNAKRNGIDLRTSVYPEEVLLTTVTGVATILLQNKNITQEQYLAFIDRVVDAPYFSDPKLGKQVKKSGKMLVHGWVDLRSVADMVLKNISN